LKGKTRQRHLQPPHPPPGEARPLSLSAVSSLALPSRWAPCLPLPGIFSVQGTPRLDGPRLGVLPSLPSIEAPRFVCPPPDDNEEFRRLERCRLEAVWAAIFDTRGEGSGVGALQAQASSLSLHGTTSITLSMVFEDGRLDGSKSAALETSRFLVLVPPGGRGCKQFLVPQWKG